MGRTLEGIVARGFHRPFTTNREEPPNAPDWTSVGRRTSTSPQTSKDTSSTLWTHLLNCSTRGSFSPTGTWCVSDVYNNFEFTADTIRRLLGNLNEELDRRGQQVAVYVVGGANNMALAVDSSRTTTDSDAVVESGYEQLTAAAAASQSPKRVWDQTGSTLSSPVGTTRLAD